MIGPATTPQVWVEQWWQNVTFALIDANSLYREGKHSAALGAAYAAQSHLDSYMMERETLACRAVNEDIGAVRSLMALKYELRG